MSQNLGNQGMRASLAETVKSWTTMAEEASADVGCWRQKMMVASKRQQTWQGFVPLQQLLKGSMAGCDEGVEGGQMNFQGDRDM